VLTKLSARDRTFNELSSGEYSATLVDEHGDPVPLSEITSLQLTLVDFNTGEVINDRDHQDALNTNDVTVHPTSGLLTWSIQPEDNIIVTNTIKDGTVERHRATFELQFGENKRQNHKLLLDVVQFNEVVE
jgi:hypothetical protein